MDKLLTAAIIAGVVIFVLLFALTLSISIYRNGLFFATTKERVLTIVSLLIGSAIISAMWAYTIYTL